ncbi:hypothetical protein AX16_006956 [Volvariella volvacea WC 439]|nr:hypothetical protein AX16_006956 [Volvariella volvacea WC 439]
MDIVINALTVLFCAHFHSGAFDVPKAKCPPDRGSSDWVTGSPASVFSSPLSTNSLSSSPEFSFFSSSTSSSSIKSNDTTQSPTSTTPNSPTLPPFDFKPIQHGPTLPRDIPKRTLSDMSTPPLTPDNGSGYDDGQSMTSSPTQSANDALDFLMNLFPNDGLTILPHAKSISITVSELGATFEGVVVEMPGQPKTLYVDGKRAEAVGLRESIVALLDLADDNLNCQCLIISLEKSSPLLSGLLHALMYVGGTVVTKPIFPANPNVVLVGLEM